MEGSDGNIQCETDAWKKTENERAELEIEKATEKTLKKEKQLERIKDLEIRVPALISGSLEEVWKRLIHKKNFI